MRLEELLAATSFVSGETTASCGITRCFFCEVPRFPQNEFSANLTCCILHAMDAAHERPHSFTVLCSVISVCAQHVTAEGLIRRTPNTLIMSPLACLDMTARCHEVRVTGRSGHHVKVRSRVIRAHAHGGYPNYRRRSERNPDVLDVSEDWR